MRNRREGKVAVSFGESHKNASFLTCQKMCSYRFAWQAWHFVTFDGCAVSMEEATKTCLSRRVKRCAHVALRGQRGT